MCVKAEKVKHKNVRERQWMVDGDEGRNEMRQGEMNAMRLYVFVVYMSSKYRRIESQSIKPRPSAQALQPSAPP